MKTTKLYTSPKLATHSNQQLVAIVVSLLACTQIRAQDAPQPKTEGTNATGTVVLPEMDVIAHALDAARSEIVPSLGATEYHVGTAQIESQSQGANAPLNQTVLRLPGVAQDSFGQLHLRGEHANLQYRVDGVLIPEGISGFGQELSSRLVDHLSLITGALPAQYGFRTTGVVDITTKTGSGPISGETTIYGGSHDTFNPSFELSGRDGKFSYFFSGSYLQNDLGIENPTSSRNAIHDETEQITGFADLAYIIDDTSRVNLILSANRSRFQLPNNPGQPQNFTLAGVPGFDSARLDENQNETNEYGILSYQKTLNDLSLQASVFTRYSGLKFKPDQIGDLIFNGIASNVDRSIVANGTEWDLSYKVNDSHTLRGGFTFTEQQATVNTSNRVFPASGGAQTSDIPFIIGDNSKKTGFEYGAYLQDEWKLADKFTLNVGGRFDAVNAYIDENQFSPRVNFVWQPVADTTLHIGYARYFTPPPLELVQQGSVTKFNNTTNATEVTESSPVKSERSDYFDAGIGQQFTSNFHAGLDAYYKHAKNQLDEGQFGQALIFSPFNYATGETYGVELTANYDQDGFSAYANLACSRATGEKITSGQFQFSQNELDYISSHSVHLDHDQLLTASFGGSYSWSDTKIYADCLYGSGLRKGFANTESLPAYATVNIGVEQAFHVPNFNTLKARIDVVNLLDHSYEIRDGSGIGVGAPQFGARRGIYCGVSMNF